MTNKVSKIQHEVGSLDIIVPTLNTLHHKSLLYSWLALPDYEVNNFNHYVINNLNYILRYCRLWGSFFDPTSLESLLMIFDHYCEYPLTSNSVVMALGISV